MQYLFNEKAADELLTIKGDTYKYLFKVRRHKMDEIIYFRNNKMPQILYRYKVVSLNAKVAVLEKVDSEKKELKAKTALHIGWCVVEQKSIEKVLPMLNEIGVDKISFVYCDRSQKNINLDLKRFQRILQSSSQQCGRSVSMHLEILKNIDEFLLSNPEAVILDFCDDVLGCNDKIETLLIGCEGGFSEREREKFASHKRFRLDTPMILRSESAVFCAASKILL